ncbi:MAG: DUF2281 domain-containing protein [Limnospira sp. PMC 894.15]|uniref:type II toxin-antitoxin system Phd/YefM family antitoxin n=1 Tax=unclassified Limnospira TaxID=2642885 RepID=UPI0028E0E7E4|nr:MULTISPECIES: DUF2281 domain-containing protein [unclassified Limnospira]MDT9189666.1 DUF2281 domain-containing protein [Limnospira sp. PMC 894.15]MDT9235522.1 DUF2281 domain-containing protein [Limnospira sp. PMC 917.15]MDT9276356.1 DUF2281 domain-containing protein [Limnospira sp. PMC 737.11]
MKIIDINQALPQIMELIEMAFAGEEIIISNNNQQTIKITPVLSPQPRPPLFGCDKDRISLRDDFDEPLDDFQDYI